MNQIHPTALIGDNVELGVDNVIGPFVIITGPAIIGDENWFGAGVVIGATPEVRSFPHPGRAGHAPGAGIRIGDRNVIREYAQLHGGWHEATKLGDDAFIMNQVYVAHDCTLGDGVTIASSVLLAGHVMVGAGANLGLGVSVHQRRFIGAWSMIGMGSVVTRDVPPFAKAYGNPARVTAANAVGLLRSGVDEETAAEIERRYVAGDTVGLADFAEHARLGESVRAWMARAQ